MDVRYFSSFILKINKSSKLNKDYRTLRYSGTCHYKTTSPWVTSHLVAKFSPPTEIFSIFKISEKSNRVWWMCELTPCSQRADLNYPMVGSFWGHSVSSQWTHKMSSHCELAESFPWVCNSHIELTATTAWWADPLISWIPTASSPCDLQTHIKLPVRSNCESSCEFTQR